MRATYKGGQMLGKHQDSRKASAWNHLSTLLRIGYWVVLVEHWGGKWDKGAESKSLN
jgi:hypothetical protein